MSESGALGKNQNVCNRSGYIKANVAFQNHIASREDKESRWTIKQHKKDIRREVEKGGRKWTTSECELIQGTGYGYRKCANDDKHCCVVKWPKKSKELCCDPDPKKSTLNKARTYTSKSDANRNALCEESKRIKDIKCDGAFGKIDMSCMREKMRGTALGFHCAGYPHQSRIPLESFCDPQDCAVDPANPRVFSTSCSNTKIVENFCRQGKNLINDKRCRNTCDNPKDRPAWCQSAITDHCQAFPESPECACISLPPALRRVLVDGSGFRVDCGGARCEAALAKNASKVLKKNSHRIGCPATCVNILDLNAGGSIDIGRTELNDDCFNSIKEQSSSSSSSSAHAASKDTKRFDAQKFIGDVMQNPQDHIIEIGVVVLVMIVLLK